MQNTFNRVAEERGQDVFGEGQAPTSGGGMRYFRIFPECDRWIYFSFLAFVVARYVQLGARRDILATLRFEFILGLVVIGLAVYQLGSLKPDLRRSKSLLILISLLFFAMIIQLPLAADPVIARTIFLDRVIKFAFLTFFMVVFIQSPRFLKWFLAAFLFSVFYITLESVEGLISGNLIWQNQGVMRLHGAVPIYMHPNSLGGVAMGAVPFVVFLFPHTGRWYLKLGLLALLVTSLVCIIYSGSRTAYVGMISFIFWWMYQSKSKMKFLVRGLIVGALVLSVIPGEYVDRFKSIGGEEKEGHSTEKRKEILEDAVVILGENPLGVGVASFPRVRWQRFGRSQDTHNLYLEVATNLGIQGFIIFMGLVMVMMAQFRKVTQVFRAQRLRLKILLKNGRLPMNLRRHLVALDEDLGFMIAVGKAGGAFILIRLVLGMFGMDLYEVYWWFGAGLAMVLIGLSIRSGRALQKIEDLAHSE